jgi:hypothetical protein
MSSHTCGVGSARGFSIEKDPERIRYTALGASFVHHNLLWISSAEGFGSVPPLKQSPVPTATAGPTAFDSLLPEEDVDHVVSAILFLLFPNGLSQYWDDEKMFLLEFSCVWGLGPP